MRALLNGGGMVMLVIVAAGTTLGESGPEDKRLAGYWSGKVYPPGEPWGLPVILYRKEDSKGVVKWHFDSPFESIWGNAERSSEFDAQEGALAIHFVIGSSFIGKLNKHGNEFRGTWKFGGGLTSRLTLKRSDEMPFRRPQEPKPPFPYRSEEVTYENKKAKVKLAGTLTLPQGKGPFSAAILTQGSGPHGRDEDVRGHKPFLVIADYLTRRGIAVLRVDKRGIGASSGSYADTTAADLAEDVLAGVVFLKNRKEIDGARIGQIGHSEGGSVGPLAAAQSKDIAFLVILAGAGLKLEEVSKFQYTQAGKLGGSSQAEIDLSIKCLTALFDLLKREENPGEVEKQFYQKLAAWRANGTLRERIVIARWESPAGRQVVRTQLTPLNRSWALFDPVPVLRKVRCPVLALSGDKDTQVQHDPNVSAIAKALKDGGNPDVTTRVFPNVNHMFQTCKTGQLPEYGAIEETIAPRVLETMTNWIRARVGLKEQK